MEDGRTREVEEFSYFVAPFFFSGRGDLKKVSDFLHVYTRVFYGNSVFSYWEKRKVGLSLESFRI